MATVCVRSNRRIEECWKQYEDSEWLTKHNLVIVRAHDLLEMNAVFNELMRQTPDDEVVMVIPDDCLFTERDADRIENAVRGGHEAVSGWVKWSRSSSLAGVKLKATGHLARVGEKGPVGDFDSPVATMWISSLGPMPGLQRVFFSGLALHGMKASMWKKFPLTESEYQTDLRLAQELHHAGVQLWVDPQVYIEHLAEEKNRESGYSMEERDVRPGEMYLLARQRKALRLLDSLERINAT